MAGHGHGFCLALVAAIWCLCQHTASSQSTPNVTYVGTAPYIGEQGDTVPAGYTMYRGWYLGSAAGSILRPMAYSNVTLMAAGCLADPYCLAFDSGFYLRYAVKPTWAWTNTTGNTYVKNGVVPGALQPLNITGYYFVSMMDSPRYTIPGGLMLSAPHLNAQTCNADPTCVGLTAYTAQLKRRIRTPRCQVPITPYWNQNDGMYIKVGAVLQDPTPPAAIPGFNWQQNLDSTGNDITRNSTATMEQLASMCVADPNCKGFNTNGFIKSTIRPRAEWSGWGDAVCDRDVGLFVKQEVVTIAATAASSDSVCPGELGTLTYSFTTSVSVTASLITVGWRSSAGATGACTVSGSDKSWAVQCASLNAGTYQLDVSIAALQNPASSGVATTASLSGTVPEFPKPTIDFSPKPSGQSVNVGQKASFNYNITMTGITDLQINNTAMCSITAAPWGGYTLSCPAVASSSAVKLTATYGGAKAGQNCSASYDVPLRVSVGADPLGDCAAFIPNCNRCRFQFYRGTTTKAICESCTRGYQVKAGGRACWCAPGYYRDDPNNFPDRCVKCGYNAYCPGAKANRASSEVHNECGINKMTTTEYAASDRECLAKPGYGWAAGDGSQECKVGFYNPGNNNRKCTRCPGGLTTASTGAFSTQQCGAPAGYFYLRGRAIACGKGTYKPEFGNSDYCHQCPNGFTTADGEVGKASAADCKYVMPGYSAPASGITIGTTAATMCPAGTYRAEDALYTAGTAVVCTPCPAGMGTEPNATGSSSPDNCLVLPGYGWKSGPSPGSATQCGLGSYNPGWNREPCSSCGGGTMTTDVRGSINPDDCKVPAGHGTNRTSDGLTLFGFACPLNTYGRSNDTYGLVDVECVKCPENTHTKQVASSAGSQCLTNPGYGWYDGQVLQCEYASYNGGDNQNPCTLCNEGYNTSAPGSTISSNCQVAAGWISDGSSGVKPCQLGSYKDWLGASPNTCQQCPNGTTTTVAMAATEESDCDACRPGYGNAVIDLESPECTICSSGTYSKGAVKGGAACAQCPHPFKFSGKMVSRQGVSTPEECYPEFTTDAAYGMENDEAWDTISMGPSLQLQAALNSLSACQSGCSASAMCIYLEWQEWRGAGNEAQMCHFKLAGGVSSPNTFGDELADYIIFEIAVGRYATYLAVAGEDVDLVGETIDSTSYATRQVAIDACNQQEACIGITHKSGASNNWRTFKGTKREGAVGKVRVVGEAINPWIAEPSQ